MASSKASWERLLRYQQCCHHCQLCFFTECNPYLHQEEFIDWICTLAGLANGSKDELHRIPKWSQVYTFEWVSCAIGLWNWCNFYVFHMRWRRKKPRNIVQLSSNPQAKELSKLPNCLPCPMMFAGPWYKWHMSRCYAPWNCSIAFVLPCHNAPFCSKSCPPDQQNITICWRSLWSQRPEFDLLNYTFLLWCLTVVRLRGLFRFR
jgi:hypothetical protein